MLRRPKRPRACCQRLKRGAARVASYSFLSSHAPSPPLPQPCLILVSTLPLQPSFPMPAQPAGDPPPGSAAGFRTQRSPGNGRLPAEPASSEAVCEALREVLVSEKHRPASLPVASARPAARTCGVIHGCPREARGGNELHVLLVMAGCLQPGLCGPTFLPP